MTYAATSSAPRVATVNVSGSHVTVTPVAAGVATITVTATGTGGSTAIQRFTVRVERTAVFTGTLRTGSPLRAAHFFQLRTRIAALRARVGLQVARWTDPILTAGATPVKRVHLVELRDALDAVYDNMGRPRPSYTDRNVIAGVTAIKTAHVAELRNAVLALE